MVDADPAVTIPRRIAVVNRGEAAVRLIRAVRELNAEHGYGITTIALHTDAERRAMFVRQADDAVTLRRTSAGIAYLDHAELERALLESKADAVWVGWGFVAEDIAFAELCERLGLTFIGPSPAAMRTLGDKVEAKLLAERSAFRWQSWTPPAPPYVRTSSARWQRSSKLCTTWSGHARWVRSTRSFRRLNCVRGSWRLWSVGWPGRWTR